MNEIINPTLPNSMIIGLIILVSLATLSIIGLFITAFVKTKIRIHFICNTDDNHAIDYYSGNRNRYWTCIYGP